MHVAEAKRRMGTEIPWLCDSMANEMKHAFGGAPNGEFIIDPDGTIVRKRFWSNPITLRSDLVELIGPVENPTPATAIEARFATESDPLPSGVVPKLELPELRPVITNPDLLAADSTYFVKLRAEADRSLLMDGSGKLYLRFSLDPIYQVHWNNEAAPLRASISAPQGVEVTPSELVAPDVEVPADIDPREFLVDVSGAKEGQRLEVVVDYMACDDALTFCVPVQQRYRIRLRRDRDGGSRPETFMVEMFADVRDFDTDGDGNITVDELPEGEVTLFIGHMDYNENQVIEPAEIDHFFRMFNNGKGLRPDDDEQQP